MDLNVSNPPKSSRPGVSTALIVGLLLGVTIAALRPGAAVVSRDSAAQRLATRQLAQTLARAVRELGAADRDKPAITWVHPVRAVADISDAGMIPAAWKPGFVRPLRESLLALPPPAV